VARAAPVRAPLLRRLLLAAGLAAACAVAGTALALWATEGGGRHASTVAVVATVEVPPAGGGIVVPYFKTAPENRPLAPRLAVFRRPRRPHDRWPDSFLAGAATNDFYYEDGGMLLARSRLVLSGPVAVYAVPSRRGSVCYMTAWEEGGCEEDLPRGYDFQFTTIGKRVAVFGLLGDGVQITAAAGGKRLVVHLGENAYLVELPRPFPRRGRLAFHRPDGTDAVVLVPERHPSIRIVVRPASTSGAGR
jgi:hypothetical protein